MQIKKMDLLLPFAIFCVIATLSSLIVYSYIQKRAELKKEASNRN